MIKISIKSISEYCDLRKSLEPLNGSYSILQLIALWEKSKEAKIEMRRYIDEIINISNYLVDILSVLSMLSEEYYNPSDKDHNGERQLFRRVLLFIKNKWMEKLDRLPKSIMQKSMDYEKEYNAKCKSLNEFVKKKDGNNMKDVQFYYNAVIDTYIEGIQGWVSDFYSEFKKYCLIGDTQDYIFTLDNKFSNFRVTLIDTGDSTQKKLIDDCIEEFNELIKELDNIVIDLNQQSKLSNNKNIIQEYGNIDYRSELFKEHNILKDKFDALMKIENKDGDCYIENNEERKRFRWNDTKVLFTVL